MTLLRHYILLVLLSISTISGIAQITDTYTNIIAVESVKYRTESDKTLTLEQITTTDTALLPLDATSLKVTPEQVVWLHLKLPTGLDTSKQYVLSIGAFDDIVLYYPTESGTYGSYQNGKLVKPSQRVLDNHIIAFPIDHLMNATPFWMRIIHYNLLEKDVIVPQLIDESTFNQLNRIANKHQEHNNLVIGLLSGLLLGFFIISISFYLSNRKPYYIYYAIYVLFNLVLLIFTSEKYGSLDIYFSQYPWVLIHFETIFFGTLGLFYLLFLREFIGAVQYSRAIERTLNILILYEVLLNVLDLFYKIFLGDVNFIAKIVEFGPLPFIIGLLFIMYKLFVLGNKILYFIAWGISCVILGMIGYIVVWYIDFGSFSLFDNHNIVFHFSIIVELLFFSLAMSEVNHDFSRKKIVQEASLKNQITDLERAALQAQMNPHFIFNCLNSIQNFILQNDRQKAVEYLSRFASLVRHNLDASINGSISLEEEISLLDNYLSLERERFNHQFDYTITVESSLKNQKIEFPPLLIQPYIENAIIHGLAKKGKGAKVKIHFSQDTDQLVVKVIDNGKGYIYKEHSSSNHKSVGMTITQARLALLGNATKNPVRIKTLTNAAGQPNGTEIQIQLQLFNIPS